jgi:hypothetical protein
MRLFRSVIDPGSRWLTRHFSRLRRTLEGLYDRLRDAIAVAVTYAPEAFDSQGNYANSSDTLFRSIGSYLAADDPPPPVPTKG